MRMINILVYVSIFVGLLLFKAWWDYRAKKKGRIINHMQSSIIDIAIYTVSSYFLFCAPSWCSVGVAVGILGTTLAARWILYDLLYNVINKHKLGHLGGSAGTDQMLKWFEGKGISQFIIKGIILGIGINLIVWL